LLAKCISFSLNIFSSQKLAKISQQYLDGGSEILSHHVKSSKIVKLKFGNGINDFEAI
jgi:hypothetical protein